MYRLFSDGPDEHKRARDSIDHFADSTKAAIWDRGLS
jgi:hypothetical protein